jgi:uncharacterized protein (TIGR00252 family)
MSTTEVGRRAESTAAQYLEQQGYTIVVQNWRTRWCEIDIVATKRKTVYFFEVKYRKSANWGDGLDAVTAKKQQQMQFAAEVWTTEKKWRSGAQLGVIAMTGEPPQVTTVILLD